MKKSQGFVNIILIIVVVVLVGVIGYFTLFKKSSTPITDESNTSISSPISKIETENFKTPILTSISKEEYVRYSGSLVKNTIEETHEECMHLNNYKKALHCEEKFNLSKHPQVKRIDDFCLSITIKNTDKKVLCDDRREYPDTTYIFYDYIPNVGYWFLVKHYEGSSQLLINENTGEEMHIFGMPILSPSRQKFLSVGIDMSEAAYNPNGFQVWTKNGDLYLKTMEYSPQQIFGIIDSVWVDENTFYFIKRTFTYMPTETKYTDEYASYTIENKNLTVTFPKAGDTLTEGQTYNITWTNPGNSSGVSYGLYLENDKVGSIRIGDTSQTSFSWKVPVILSFLGEDGPPPDVAPTDGYRISFTTSDGAIQYSPVFKIVPQK